MKKGIFLIVFLLIQQVLFAQNRSFATLEIFTNYSKKADKNNAVQIYFNNKLITSIQFTEKLVYKFYSEGRISVMFIENNKRTSTIIDIKHDSTYYFLYGWYEKEKKGTLSHNDWYDKEKVNNQSHNDWYEKTGYKLIAKALAGKIAFKNTITQEEDIRNPIGTIPQKSENVARQGTGFLLHSDGYILTNQHVINGAKKITVSGINGEYNLKVNADVIAIDYQNDLALLKINSSLITFPEPPYSLIKSKENIQGTSIFALGYPIKEIMGDEIKVTDGIIKSTSGYKGSIAQFQFSAAIQPGNSGGPLLNDKGQVIGIVTAKLLTEKMESVGYATKSDYISVFLDLIPEIDYVSKEKSMSDKTLAEKIKLLSNFVYIIETE
jgi:S1-C subfamily serine protease